MSGFGLGFFFVLMFHFFSPWLLPVRRQQPFSRDTETCVGTADIVLMSTCLTQRPSVCMHYWLALYWLLLPQPCSIDWRLRPVNRAANSACLWLFFFFFLVAASDVKGCLSHLLCPWQPGRFTGSSSLCSESLRSGSGDEVEGRLREGCQGIVVQRSYRSPQLVMLGLCIHGEGMCSVLCVRADGSITRLLTHNHSVWTQTCASMRSNNMNNNNNALLMCGAGPSLTQLQRPRIVWSDRRVSEG